MDKLNTNSIGGQSPHFFKVDSSTLRVQGYETTDKPALPGGEDQVIVPALLAVDAAAGLDPNGMNLNDLGRMLTVFGETAFHLETRPYYAVETEAAAFRAWQEHAGVPHRSDEAVAGWVQLVEDHTAAGRTIRRVHLTHGTLSEYERFQLAVQQAHNIPAGEQVRVVDAGDAPELRGIGRDFWLFDNRIGVLMAYDDDGHLTRLDRMSNSEVTWALDMAHRAWTCADELAAETVVKMVGVA